MKINCLQNNDLLTKRGVWWHNRAARGESIDWFLAQQLKV